LRPIDQERTVGGEKGKRVIGPMKDRQATTKKKKKTTASDRKRRPEEMKLQTKACDANRRGEREGACHASGRSRFEKEKKKKRRGKQHPSTCECQKERAEKGEKNIKTNHQKATLTKRKKMEPKTNSKPEKNRNSQKRKSTKECPPQASTGGTRGVSPLRSSN